MAKEKKVEEEVGAIETPATPEAPVPVVEDSPAKKEYHAIVEKFKKQNPLGYERQKVEIESKLASF